MQRGRCRLHAQTIARTQTEKSEDGGMKNINQIAAEYYSEHTQNDIEILRAVRDETVAECARLVGKLYGETQSVFFIARFRAENK